MGIKNAVFSAREMYRNMYTQKWDALRLRENGDIKYLLLTSKTDYYVYIKIPSEVVPKFYYDVVVRFMPPPDKNGAILDRTLNDYLVQFYSNDPSFVYTFAHAFSKNDMIIKDLNLRMSKLALKQKADQRNPSDQIGYVKSLYFAYLEIKHKGLLSKVRYTGATKYDKSLLLSMIMDADEKIDQRKKEADKIAKKEKRKKGNAPKKPEPKESKSEKSDNKRNIGIITPKSKISGKSKITGKSKIAGKR